jgi:hypothetical protein
MTLYIHRQKEGHKSYDHVFLVEKAAGRKMKQGEEVHHVDGNGRNNSPDNLVACPDRAYHCLLHRRTEALVACGNANWRKCRFCQQYDNPKNLYISPNDRCVHHKSCANAYYLRKQS